MSNINKIRASAIGDFSEGSLKWRASVYREFGPDKMHLSCENYFRGTNTYLDVQDALKESRKFLQGMLDDVLELRLR